MLKKAVRKSLLKNKKLLFGITALFVLAIFIFSLAKFTFDYLEINNQAYIDSTNQEDFRLYTDVKLEEVFTEEYITNLEQELNINMEQRRVTTYPQEEVKTQITSFDETAEINKLTVSAGELPYNKGEVFILEQYALENNINVGDTIVINGIEYIVSGYGFMPEYTLPFDMIQGSMPGTPFLAVYMNEESYAEIEKDNEALYYAVTTNEELSKSDEKALQDAMLNDYTISVPEMNEYGVPQVDENGNVITQEISVFFVALDSEFNLALSGLLMEINTGRTSFNIFCFVIIAFTMFLTIILYNSIFKNQRREVGILKAEGLSNRELKFNFTKYLVYILLIGAVIGVTLGYIVAPSFASIYMEFYTIPLTVSASTSIVEALTSILFIIIGLVVLVYFFSIRRNINIPPLLLVKNIENSKKPRFKFNGALKKLPFTIKYKLSILLRNFSYILVLSIGVFIASFLLLMGALMMGTMNTMMEETYTKMFTYDYAVSFSPGYTPEENIDSTLSYNAEIIDTSSDVEVAEDSYVKFIGYDVNDATYVNLTDVDGNEIPASDYNNGVVISSIYANTFELEIGDTITFINPIDANEEITVTVNNIANDGFYASIYADLDYFQALIGVNDTFVNGQYISENDKADIEASDPDADFMSVIDLQMSMDESMSVFYAMIGIVMLIASIIAFISLTLITSIVVNNNRKTISIMKVLGYDDKEIRKMTTSSYKYIIFVVYFMSMPIIEAMIQSVINYAMRDMDFVVTINLTFKYAIVGLVIIYIIYFIAMGIAQRSIKKISLAESLKIDE